MRIAAATFKAECLRLMDEVARTGQPVVITKHGKPVAQLAPVPGDAPSMFGYMKNSLRISGDILASTNETWSAPSGDEDALYGPLNNANQLERVQGFIDRLPGHAEITNGGARVGDRGYFFAPTVVAGVHQDDEIVNDEVFGPVISVQRFGSEDQAVEWANALEYGLSSSVWTTDHGTAMRMSKRLDFGCVWVNTHIPLVAEMPHGGFKHSGYGKDLSAYAIDDYTRIKHVMTNLEA